MRTIFIPSLILSLFFILGNNQVYSQCDSLELAAKNGQGQEKIDALNEYARCFLGSDFETMDSISNVALNLSNTSNYYEGMARAKQNLGLVNYYFRNERELALENYEEALKLYRFAGDSLGVAKALGDIGSYYHYDKEIGKALGYFAQGLQICEDENFGPGISVFSSNIGSIYSLTKQFDEAIKYFKKAYSISKNGEISQNYVIQATNIGTAYSELNMPDSAKFYLDIGLKGSMILGDPNRIGGVYVALSELYFSANSVDHPDWDKRKQYTDSAYYYYSNSSRIENQIIAAHNKGYVTELEGNPSGAKKYYQSVLSLIPEDFPPTGSIVESYFRLGAIQGNSGDYKNGFNNVLQAILLLKDLNERTYSETVEELKMIFEIDQMKKEVELIQIDKELSDLKLEHANNENARKDIEAKKKQIQIYAIGGGLLLAIALGFVAFRGYRNKLKSNKIISQQKDEVEHAKKEIEHQHKEITDSIEYAKRIQTAILPPAKLVNDLLPNSFILYKPKDIVAGDFYWMETVQNKLLFAAADCTGHGVPGAMVSVVCNNALNRSIREFELSDPGQILDKAREIVIKEFEKSEEEVKDGMDIALCALDGKELIYAGAHNPLWIIRNGAKEVEEIKADKQPIGRFEISKNFKSTTVQLNSGDSFYIFSDGFADQFGGEKGKKFKSANFKRLLVSVQDKSIADQKELIDSAFIDWSKGYEQLDDVCVIGVKIP